MRFDIEAVNGAVGRIVRAASSPATGYSELLRFCKGQCPGLPKLFEQANAEAETSGLAAQLKRTIATSPIPAGVTTLYFGLFEATSEERDSPYGGFYVSGVQHFDSDDLDTLCAPPYYPENRYLRSRLLDRAVQAAAADRQNGQFIFYVMMLGVGGILARFAAKRLALKQKVVVGFDDGDVIEV